MNINERHFICLFISYHADNNAAQRDVYCASQTLRLNHVTVKIDCVYGFQQWL